MDWSSRLSSVLDDDDGDEEESTPPAATDGSSWQSRFLQLLEEPSTSTGDGQSGQQQVGAGNDWGSRLQDLLGSSDHLEVIEPEPGENVENALAVIGASVAANNSAAAEPTCVQPLPVLPFAPENLPITATHDFVDIMRRCMDENCVTDERSEVVAQHLGDSTALQSTVASAEQCNVSPMCFVRRRNMLACVYLFAERFFRLSLQHMFHVCIALDENLIFYVELEGGDETPLVVRHRRGNVVLNADGDIQLLVEQAVEGIREGTDAQLVEAARATMEKKKTTKGIAKIYQSRVDYAYIVRLNGQLLVITGSQQKGIQILMDGKGKTICKAHGVQDALCSSTQRFQHKLTVINSDKASANPASRKLFRKHYRPTFDEFTLYCEEHIAATILHHSTHAYDSVFSGIIHMALACRPIAAGCGFSDDLTNLVVDRIYFCCKVLSPQAIIYKKAVVDQLLSDKSDSARADVLTHVFNGDWRNTDGVEILVPPHLQGEELASWKQIRLVEILNGGMWALHPRSFAVYNRGDWNGVQEAIKEPALLDRVHGLLVPGVLKFLDRFSKKAKPKAKAKAKRQQLAITGPLAKAKSKAKAKAKAKRTQTIDPSHLQSIRGEEGEDASSSGITRDSVGLDVPGPATRENAGESKEKEGTTAVDNETHRKVTREFIQSRGPGMLMWLHGVTGPVSQMLKNISVANGVRASHRRSGLASKYGPDDPSVRYPLELAASKKHESEARTDLIQNLLMAEHQGAFLREDELTERTQTDIFTTGTRTLALLEKLMVQPHEADPVRAFKRLAPGADRASEEATSRSLPPCKRHKFMTSMCEKHTSFDDEDADAKFHVINHLAKTVIGDVEVGHSRFRRRLLSASMQTHKASMENVAAMWTHAEARRNHRHAMQHLGFRDPVRKRIKKRSAARANGAAVATKGSRKTKSGGGGFWRAYLRKRSQARKNAGESGFARHGTWESVSYKALDGEQKNELKPLAETMTIAWRHKRQQHLIKVSKKREIERAAGRQAWEELLQQHRATQIDPGGPRGARPELDDGQDLEVAASVAVRGGLPNANASLALISTDAVSAVAKNTRRFNLAANTVQREQDVAFSDAIKSYTEQGRDAVDILPDGASQIGGVSAFAKSSPIHANACAFQYHPDSLGVSQRIVAVLNGEKNRYAGDRRAFMDMWSNLCAPVACNASEFVADEEEADDSADERSRCVSCGTCVCSPLGLILDRFANSFEGILKKIFVPKSDLRLLLNKAHIVARLTGVHAIDDASEDAECKTMQLYVQLGHVYWSPFSIMASCLTYVEGDIFDDIHGCLVKAVIHVCQRELATIDFPPGSFFCLDPPPLTAGIFIAASHSYCRRRFVCLCSKARPLDRNHIFLLVSLTLPACLPPHSSSSLAEGVSVHNVRRRASLGDPANISYPTFFPTVFVYKSKG